MLYLYHSKCLGGLIMEVYEGCRIRLISMGEDPCPVEPGAVGTVFCIDSIGSIHVRWDNGRSLALIPGVDVFEVVS